MTPAEAEVENRREFEAESKALMRRALARAEEKRAIEYEKIFGSRAPRTAEVTEMPTVPKKYVRLVPKKTTQKTAKKTFWGPRPVRSEEDVKKHKIGCRDNGRIPHYYEISAVSKSLVEWCEYYDVKHATVYSRIARGIPLETALTMKPYQKLKNEATDAGIT